MDVAPLVLSLIRRIEQERQATGAVRVTAVRLRVGECAGVEPSRLVAAFERSSRGTVAHGARLKIERVSLESQCDACGSRFRVVRFCFQCPYCGGRRTRVVAGREVVVESLTVVNECDLPLTRLH